MARETGTLPLIHTKLQHPRLPGGLIPRPRLLDRLHAGLDRKLTLISAMAGTGKTTLLVQWLEECPQPSAWVSLEDHDNDWSVFLSYLCGSIRTVFPSACEKTFNLLNAPQAPPARVITTWMSNELSELTAAASEDAGMSKAALILALDDYNHITEPLIHEIVADLIDRLPSGVHLALSSRTDPTLPLIRWRGRGEVTEIRSADLCFTSEETLAFLEGTTGTQLNPETIRLLKNKTRGWIVGLRLAALYVRDRPDAETLVQGFGGPNDALLLEYLLSEVLGQQTTEVQDFVLRTSILDRFCAPLCDALTGVSVARSKEIIAWIAQTNLFLVDFDGEGEWYRYHDLFRDLLRHELTHRYGATDIVGLHARAGMWLARNELVDEALYHFLAADDTSAAVDLVARHRYDLINRAQWARLNQHLLKFSPDVLDQYPNLLMLQAWLLYHRGRWLELPAALGRLDATLSQASLSPDEADHLQGEISALRSLQFYHAVDPESTLAHARQALAKTPREAWAVRILARLHLAGVFQMGGDSNRAYATLYSGFEEEETQSDAFRATLLLTVCFVYWLDADLQGMAQAANQCIRLSQRSSMAQILNYGHYHLGTVRYQQNDLEAAEQYFTTVVQQPHVNYGDCFSHSACGLALTHQAQGRPEDARAVTESAIGFMHETGNTTFMPVIRSLQAEIALRQGRIAQAGQWAAHLGSAPPFTPIWGFFSPHLTLVKVWLAQDTAASRGQAADLLGRVRAFCESTNNTRFLIEALALQAVLHDVEGDETAALAALEQAIALAEPGGFIRLFVDLGLPIKCLLDQLHRKGVAPDYVRRILAAFPDSSPHVLVRTEGLIETLTPRELEVLTLLDGHLTQKDIAAELVVSPSTVKTHTLNIYRKLDVRKRGEAVARAKELNLL